MNDNSDELLEKISQSLFETHVMDRIIKVLTVIFNDVEDVSSNLFWYRSRLRMKPSPEKLCELLVEIKKRKPPRFFFRLREITFNSGPIPCPEAYEMLSKSLGLLDKKTEEIPTDNEIILEDEIISGSSRWLAINF